MLSMRALLAFGVSTLWASITPAIAAAPGIPATPLVVDMAAMGLEPGQRGGVLRTLLTKEKDIRLLNAWGYARLIGWTPKLTLEPDIAQSIDVKNGRIFTIRLRKGHRWSDGRPFTSEDFRYFWQDVANNKELSPSGPPAELLNGGELPKVSFPDETTIVYEWSKSNPRFLSVLAQAREPFIYRPAHYLKQFHAKYAVKKAMSAAISDAKVSAWAALHNRMDSMYGYDNPAMPVLQPWIVTTQTPSARFAFKRNPYFHRVDKQGRQLPYLDGIDVTIVDGGLVAVKVAAGDSDLQARGLSFSDMTALKQNEAKGKYVARAWPIAKSSHVALYPNLNANDPEWRALNRDVRFRRALSLAIDRQEINKTLFFGLAQPAANAVLKSSPLYSEKWAATDANYDPKAANALLDSLGLNARDANGVRKRRSGKPVEIVVETAGESKEESDVLQLVRDHMKAVGINLLVKTSDRTVMRNRAFSGDAIMTAWSGWDNGIPTPDMSPDELAPVAQVGMAWPKWGQHFETRGKSGEAPDLLPAKELLDLNARWALALPVGRSKIWNRMLQIHAENAFVIGIVSGVLQPVVVSKRLHNVPEKGVWSFDPGAQFGMYRMDGFWLSK